MGSPLTVLGEERGGGRKGERGVGGGKEGGRRGNGWRERVSNITLAHACYMKCLQLIWTTNNVILWLESQLKIR